MRKIKEFSVRVTRMIKTAQYENIEFEASETYTLEPGDDLEVQRTRAMRKLTKAAEIETERERARYNK